MKTNTLANTIIEMGSMMTTITIITDIEGEDFSMTCLTIKWQSLKLS